MAFRASSIVAADGLETAKKLAVTLKTLAESKAAEITASGLDGIEVIHIAQRLKNVRDQLSGIAGTPGLVQYAKDQENDQTYSVGAEFNALLAAIDTVLAEIHSTYPKSTPGGYAEVYTLNANGSITPRQFTSGQLSGLKSELDTLAAAIS